MNKKVVYSIAMSKEDGCLVMVRTRGKQVEIVGSVTREQSEVIAEGVLDWNASPLEQIIAEELNGPQPRLPYNH